MKGRPLVKRSGWAGLIGRSLPWPALAVLCGLLIAVAAGAEALPPAPRDHFNDYAGLVRPETARQLNQELAQFERDTSNQIVVAVFKSLPAGAAIDDYTVRVAQAWRVGQRERKNGAVLFVFSQDRKLRIQVGYGLEGALPDALCKRIIENEITPRFRQQDFERGLAAGTRALMAAARGEYRGSGRTAADSGLSRNETLTLLFFIAAFVYAVGWVLVRLWRLVTGRPLNPRQRRVVLYDGRGATVWRSGQSTWGSSGGFGGGTFSGGGGSFSGGGGSFGGGGAGGSW